MKKLFVQVLGFLLAAQANAQIAIIFPNGGERVPQNQLGFILTEPHRYSPEVVGHADRYSPNLNEIIESRLLGHASPSVCRVGPQGTGYCWSWWGGDNLGPLTPGIYKWVVTDTAGVLIDESDGFFEVAPPTEITCEMLGEGSAWFPGETQQFRVAWREFDIGDTYSVYLSYANFEGINWYGMPILVFGTFESRDGEKVLLIPFPTNAADGIYSVTCVVIKRYPFAMPGWEPGWFEVAGTSKQFDLVLADVRVRVLGNSEYLTTTRESVVTAMRILIDARFSPQNVESVHIPLVLAMKDTNLAAECALYEGRKEISPRIWVTSDGRLWKQTSIWTTRSFKVRRGTSKVLTLQCRVLRGTGQFQWMVDPTREVTVRDHRGRPLVEHMWIFYPYFNTGLVDPLEQLTWAIENPEWGNLGWGPYFRITD